MIGAAMLAIMGGSSFCPSDFLKDSAEEHKAPWRKGKETLAKLLKEGKDARGFAIKGKGKGRVWKEKRERCELKKREKDK